MKEARKWLGRARAMKRELKALKSARESTFEMLTSITQNYNSDGAQSTKDPHKFDKLAEYSAEIDRQIDHLYEVKAEIQKAISRLDDSRYRDILSGRYLDGLTFEEIAVKIKYSYKQTCRLHGRALIKMEGILHDNTINL